MPSSRSLRRLGASAVVTVAGIVLLSACTAAPADDATTPSPMSTPSASSTPSPSPTQNASSIGTPEDSFLAWLDASRAPEAAVACGYFNAELTERMLDEFRAGGFAAADCEEMITVTAAAYKATGASADVDIETRSVSASSAELFVRYSGSSCGTVVMVPGDEHWIMTELSQQVC